MLARAGTRAAWLANEKCTNCGLREVDKEASSLDPKMKEEDKGLVRTMRIAGGIAIVEISQINEDVDDTCTYWPEEKSTADHAIWICVHFHWARREHDPLLTKAPANKKQSVCQKRNCTRRGS